jgi:hypothetical protein
VNLGEIRAERAHETSRPAADFERFQATRGRQALDLAAQAAHHVGSGRQELRVVLLAAAERDVVIRILAGAFVPFLAHAVDNIGVGHAFPVSCL